MGKNINNLIHTDDTTLMAECEEELKSLLMKVKDGNEKVGLKLNIQKIKIMASGPISSWQIDGEAMETVRDFIFLGSKITKDGDCSHEIKRCLLLGRKAMTNLDSILKSRDVTLPTKIHLVKSMVFPVVIYGCKNWTTWSTSKLLPRRTHAASTSRAWPSSAPSEAAFSSPLCVTVKLIFNVYSLLKRTEGTLLKVYGLVKGTSMQGWQLQEAERSRTVGRGSWEGPRATVLRAEAGLVL